MINVSLEYQIHSSMRPDSSMTVSSHSHETTSYSHVDDMPDDVKRLFEYAEQQHIESSLDWYRCLTSAVFSEPQTTSILVARRAGRPMAALPMLTDTGTSRKRVESLGNYYTAIYAPILATDATAADLVPLIQVLRRTHATLDTLKFSPMDPESNGYQMLRAALRAAGWLPFKFFCFGNWTHLVTESWPDYFQAREGFLRNTIKRMGKKFAAEGGTLELTCGGAQLDAALQAYQEVYAASWKVPEPYPTFIPSLVRACAQRGWLRLGVARLGGRPIAAQLWLVAHGKANIYKLAYHEDFKAFAPGTLLTAMLMQHVIEQDHVREIDYLIGDDAYKKAWMSLRRERWGLIAYNPRSMLGLIGLLRELGGRAVKYLKSIWNAKPLP